MINFIRFCLNRWRCVNRVWSGERVSMQVLNVVVLCICRVIIFVDPTTLLKVEFLNWNIYWEFPFKHTLQVELQENFEFEIWKLGNEFECWDMKIKYPLNQTWLKLSREQCAHKHVRKGIWKVEVTRVQVGIGIHWLRP